MDLRTHLTGAALVIGALAPVAHALVPSTCLSPTQANDVLSGRLSFQDLDTKRLQAIQQADVAFTGKVLGKQIPSKGKISGITHPVIWTLAIDSVAKGNPATIQSVISPAGTSFKDFRFNVGSRYQVHARRFEGNLITDNCAGNEELSEEAFPFPVVNSRQIIPQGPAPIRLPANAQFPLTRFISRQEAIGILSKKVRLISAKLMSLRDYGGQERDGATFHEVSSERMVWVVKLAFPEGLDTDGGYFEKARFTKVLDAQTGRLITSTTSGKTLLATPEMRQTALQKVSARTSLPLSSLEILRSEGFKYPTLGTIAFTIDVLAKNGQASKVYQVLLDQAGQELDSHKQQEAEWAAYQAKYGALDPNLYNDIAEVPADSSVRVLITLKEPPFNLTALPTLPAKLTPTQEQNYLRQLETQRAAFAETLVRPVADQLVQQGYQVKHEKYSARLEVSLRPETIRQLARWPQLQRVSLFVQPKYSKQTLQLTAQKAIEVLAHNLGTNFKSFPRFVGTRRGLVSDLGRGFTTYPQKYLTLPADYQTLAFPVGYGTYEVWLTRRWKEGNQEVKSTWKWRVDSNGNDYGAGQSGTSLGDFF
jgi:hypothetical protein